MHCGSIWCAPFCSPILMIMAEVLCSVRGKLWEMTGRQWDSQRLPKEVPQTGNHDKSGFILWIFLESEVKVTIGLVLSDIQDYSVPCLSFSRFWRQLSLQSDLGSLNFNCANSSICLDYRQLCRAFPWIMIVVGMSIPQSWAGHSGCIRNKAE